MSTSYRFEQVPGDRRRARGLQVAATLAHEPDALERRYGVTFEPIEDGLGETIGALLEMTPSGKQFGLYKHVAAPYPGTELYADIDSEDLQSDIAHFLEALGLDSRDLYDMIDSRTFAEDRPPEADAPGALAGARDDAGFSATAIDLAMDDQRALDAALRQADQNRLLLATVGLFFVTGLISAALLFGSRASVSHGAVLAGVVPVIAAIALTLARLEGERALSVDEESARLRAGLAARGGGDLDLPSAHGALVSRDHTTVVLALAATLLLTLTSAAIGLVSLAQHGHWVAFAVFFLVSVAAVGAPLAGRVVTGLLARRARVLEKPFR